MATVDLVETRLTAVAMVRCQVVGDRAGVLALARGTEDPADALVALSSCAATFLRKLDVDPLAVLNRLTMAALAEEDA